MKIISDGITTIANFKNESDAQRRIVLNVVNTVDVRKNYYQRKKMYLHLINLIIKTLHPPSQNLNVNCQ